MVACKKQRPFFFFFFVFIFFFTFFSSQKFSEGHGLKLELTHRHHLQRKWRNGTQLGGLKQLLHQDTMRLRAISHKHDKIRRQIQETNNYHPACSNGTENVSGELDMYSGADYHTGQYFVRFKVGSPAQKFVLIADTGSDLTWMNCKYRCRNGARCRRDLRKRHVFRADRSSSFRTVPCSSSMCKIDLANLFSLARCPSPMDPCAYDFRYLDGSAAVGLFAHETVTFSLTNRRKTRLHNVLVGCSESSRGPNFQAADGVIGLGYSNYSFAVKAAERFGGKFSYCLVDHLSPKNRSSYLIFGSHEEEVLTSFRYTELALGVIIPFYAVRIKGISIGGLMLDIPAETWNIDGIGGTIVDSGTSLTFLTQPAYQPVMAALKLSLVNFKNLNLETGPLEYCFNSTGFDKSLVPRLVFHFADGARFEPPVKSYVIDDSPGVKCLGIVGRAWPGVSVIGNIMQQNHLWEFDIKNRRLGFAASSCT